MTTTRKASDEEIRQAMTTGIAFHSGKKADHTGGNKQRTKAKKKKYITGAHGSDSARMKANMRHRKNNRNKQKPTG